MDRPGHAGRTRFRPRGFYHEVSFKGSFVTHLVLIGPYHAIRYVANHPSSHLLTACWDEVQIKSFLV